MSKSKVSLNDRAVTLSFIYMQVIFLVISGISAAAIVESGHFIRIFSQMPAVGAIYDSIDAHWMTHMRHAFHGLIAISNFVMSALVMMIGMKSTSQIIRFLSSIFGIQLLLNGLLNSSIVLVVVIGGVAHLAAIVIAASVALSSILMMLMLVMNYKYLKTFRDSGDLTEE